MKDTLDKGKAALVKSEDEMAKYYDWKRTPALDYQPGDRVYSDSKNCFNVWSI